MSHWSDDLALAPPKRLSYPIREADLVLTGAPAYVGCVSLTKNGRLLHYWQSPLDVWSWTTANASAALLGNATACRRWAGRAETLAVIVPTHMQHAAYFKQLAAKIVLHVRPGSSSATATLATVFSSLSDARSLLPPLRVKGSSFVLRPLIFDLYSAKLADGSYTTKFKFQAAKKLWALHHLQAAHTLVLDSDFVVTRPTDLTSLVKAHADRLILTPPPRLKIDQGVLKSVNRLLRSEFATFPLELPWIFDRTHLNALMAFLTAELHADDPRALARALLTSRHILFEVLLYRLFVLARHPHAWREVVRLDGDTPLRAVHERHQNSTVGMRAQPPNFLFDMALNTSERRALDYGVVSEPLWRQLQRQRVHSGLSLAPECCWLHIHMDRVQTAPVHVDPVVVSADGLSAV